MTQKLTILFDLDGTLIDTAPDLMNAHNHVMKKFGYETRSTEEIRNFKTLMNSSGLSEVKTFKDLAGKDRLVTAKFH